jgi:rhodanese-related sulfurtransferase
MLRRLSPVLFVDVWRRQMRIALYAIAIVATLALPALAQTRPGARELSRGQVMAPAEAHAKALAGELVLIDIRTPEEWRETGIPASARPITMHQEVATLIAALDAAAGGDRTRTLALICRTGSRTTFLQSELKKIGYSNVVNVAEGVVGGANGPGWVKSGLPVKRP